MENILLSKLYKPDLSDKVIERQLLDHFWHDVKDKDLVLVSSPAGTGKSTTVNLALNKQEKPFIWYSLDEWDNDFEVFMQYIVQGLEKIDLEKSHRLKEYLKNLQTIGLNSFIRSLLVVLQQIEEEFILILDDYHLINNTQIHDFISQVLQYATKNIQLIIITRMDPPFSLSRLRVQNKLKELRISELKFDVKEVTSFFKQFDKIDIDETAIRILTQKSEGWIASIQLAVLTMENTENISDFVSTFSGQHLHIVDYLIDEVLNQLDETLLDFLFLTSHFDYFSLELCQAVFNQDLDLIKTLVKQLKDKNLFLIALDHEDKWFRYHHLFRDFVLQRANLKYKNQREVVDEMYHKAGQYYEKNDHNLDAVHYYLLGQYFDQAAHLIELAWSEMDVNLQASKWLKYANRLPKSEIEKRPVLALAYGWSLLDTGVFPDCLEWFEKAKALYDQKESQSSSDLIVSDHLQYELLPVTLESAYGYIAAGMNDQEALFTHAKNAMKGLPETAYYKRGVIAMLMAFSKWHAGDLDEALSIIHQSIEDVKKGVNLLTVYSFYMVEATLLIRQGKLIGAEEILNQCFKDVLEHKEIIILNATFALLMAEIHYLRGDNPKTYEWLEKSQQYAEQGAIMDYYYRYYYLLSKVYVSEDLLEMAKNALSECEKTYFMNPIPDEVSIEDYKLKLNSLSQSYTIFERQSDADNYTQNMSAQFYIDDVLKNERKEEYDFALELCQTCLDKAQMQNRYSDEISFLALKTQIMYQMYQNTEDLETLKSLADLYNYHRPLIHYLDQKLLSKVMTVSTIENDYYKVNQSLSEPLTLRELDVLELIVEGLSNKEISEKLFLALSTVKSYIQNIYGKLEVKRRTECVKKVSTIGLIK